MDVHIQEIQTRSKAFCPKSPGHHSQACKDGYDTGDRRVSIK